jgi:type II secretory pathway pseudopilin PulG
VSGLERVRHRCRKPEAGFTLIELIIYAGLFAVVLAIVGGILLSGNAVQKSVGALTTGTNLGNLIVGSLEQGVRNSSSFKAETVTAYGQLLRSRSALAQSNGTVVWTCQAWYYSATNQSFYTKSSTTGLVAAPTPTAAPDLSTWALYGSGVQLPSGIVQPFTASTGQLAVDFQIAAGNRSPVRIDTTITPRVQSDTTTAPTPCF